MAATVISDLSATVDARLMGAYVAENLQYTSNLAAAGVVGFDNLLAEQGGQYITVPRYNPLDANGAEFQRMTDSTALTPKNFSTYTEVAALLHYADAWGARDLATLANRGLGAQEELDLVLANGLTNYFNNNMEKLLGYHLEGVFATALTANVVGDGSDTFDLGMLVDGRAKMGERQASERGVLVVDSITYAQIQKLGIASTVESSAFFEDWYRGGAVQVIGETPIIINDKVCRTLSSGVSSAYLFFGQPLTIGYQRNLNVETFRDILKKESLLSADIHWFSHLAGTRYKVAKGANPTALLLSSGDTWELAAEHTVNVPAVQLKIAQSA